MSSKGGGSLMPMLIGSRGSTGGIGSFSRPLLMRFDAPPPTTGGAAPPKSTPTMKPLPSSMQPRDMDPSYTPFPLPTRDNTFEYGPTRMQNVPDVHRARLEEHAHRFSKSTTFADDVIDSESLFDMLDDEQTTPQPAAQSSSASTNEKSGGSEPQREVIEEEEGEDPLEKAREELEAGLHGRRQETAHADLKRRVTDVPERYRTNTTRLTERGECLRPLEELLTIFQQNFYREDQDHIHTAILADLVNTVPRQSNEELCQMLHGVSSMFDLERPVGQFLKRWHMHDAASGNPFGEARLSLDLFSAYENFIRTLEEYLLYTHPERLEDADVLTALLTMYSHLRFRDLTSWGSPNDNYQVNALKAGTTGRRSTVFQLGESLYDAVMFHVASGEFAINDPAAEANLLIGMLGGVVAADTKCPDGAAMNALLGRLVTLPLTLSQAEQAWLICSASRINAPKIEAKVISALAQNRADNPGEFRFGLTCLSDVGITALSKDASPAEGSETARWKWHCDELRSTVNTLVIEHDMGMYAAKSMPNRAEVETLLWKQHVRVGLAIKEAITGIPLPFALPLCKELRLDALLLAPLHGFREVMSRANADVADALVADGSSLTQRIQGLHSNANNISKVAPFRTPLGNLSAISQCNEVRVLHSSLLACSDLHEGPAVLNTLLRSLMTSNSSALVLTTSTLLEINRQANMNPNYNIRTAARGALDTLAAFGDAMPNSNLFITPISDELLLKGDCAVEEGPDGSVHIVQHSRVPLSEGQSMWLTRRWLEEHGAPNAKVEIGIDNKHRDANVGKVMNQASGSSPASQDAAFIQIAARMRNFRGGTKFSASLPTLIGETDGLEIRYDPSPDGSFQRIGWHDSVVDKAHLMKAHKAVQDKPTTVRSYSTKKYRYWGNKDGGARDKVNIGGDRLGYGLALGSPDVRLAGLGFLAPDFPSPDERLLKSNNPILVGKRWAREAKENTSMKEDNWGL